MRAAPHVPGLALGVDERYRQDGIHAGLLDLAEEFLTAREYLEKVGRKDVGTLHRLDVPLGSFSRQCVFEFGAQFDVAAQWNDQHTFAFAGAGIHGRVFPRACYAGGRAARAQ